MRARLSHEVVYDTPDSVPISDVIESLRGTVVLVQEVKTILEALIPGLTITEISITVSDIRQASPLREAFFVGLVADYQETLAKDMPRIIHDLFGITPAPEYDSLISLFVLVLVFYSGSFIFKAAERLLQMPKTQRQLDALIADIARVMDKDEQKIRDALEKKYQQSGVTNLLAASKKFLSPSKNQNNAPLTVNQIHVPHDVVAEFSSQAQIKSEEPGPTSYALENVEIQLHAQDLDRNKQGWAAVVPSLSSRRIPMSLMLPLQPADIYTKETVRGDILVEARRNSDGDAVPVRIHLEKLR